MNVKPLVSVLTPVYNGEKYIRECIESVLAQTYINWEYILVNNCSTDNSGEIISEYAGIDKRIRLHNNPSHLRAVQNFNNALTQMTGESKYCKIVFADDWIFPTCIEKMMSVAELYPNVGLIGAYGIWGKKVFWDGLPVPRNLVTVISGKEICRKKLLDQLYVFGTATSVMYRSDDVRKKNPFYNESNIHSDTEVCFELLRNSDFAFIHELLTFSRKEEGTLTSFSEKMSTYCIGGIEDLFKFGQYYLSYEEYKYALSRRLDRYYKGLSKNLIVRHDINVLKYHINKSKTIGLIFNYYRLIWEMFMYVFKKCMTPIDTYRIIAKKMKGTTLY
jgi:glycosyltransferase involved in cell wall biosynthesis